jgi:hypothetical protein
MSESIHILSEAIAEIKNLRRENEILAAKVEVMNLFKDALAHPPLMQSQAMGVDPLWQLEKLLTAEQVAGRLQGKIADQGGLSGGTGLSQQSQEAEKLRLWHGMQAQDELNKLNDA